MIGRYRYLYPITFLAMLACNGDTATDDKDPADTNDTNDTVTDVSNWDLAFELAAATSIAGEAVDFTVSLTSTDGETETVTATLTSDLESGLRTTDTTLSPRVAGTHTVTATVTHDGADYTATASLTVSPGPLENLDLSLAAGAMIAGDTLAWTVEGLDEWDNVIAVTDAVVTADSADVTVDAAGTLTSTVPGRYEVMASYEGKSDDEVLIVDAAAPEAVSLTLSEPNPQLDVATIATVTITDAWGNETSDDWTLSVDGAGAHTIAGTLVTFHDEGTYSVVVNVDNTSLTDRVGPFVIDAFPPDLGIVTPERGSHTYSSDQEVTGTAIDAYAGLSTLTVDGDEVPVASNGYFVYQDDAEHGLNIVETVATDTTGKTSTDTRAYLSGDLLSADTALDDAILVRIEEGTGGLGTLESIGEDLVESQDLAALIPNPVFEDESIDCVWTPFGDACVTTYAVTLRASNPTFTDSTFEIDPRVDGTIRATVTIEGIDVDWNADATVASIDSSWNGDVRADALSVTLVLEPSVSNGQVSVTLVDVLTSADNFTVNVDSFLQDVLDFFGYNLGDTIQGYLFEAIEDAIDDTVPPLIEELLSDLSLDYDFELAGINLGVVAEPSSIDVTSNAIVLGLSTEVSAPGSTMTQTLTGSLYADYSPPNWSTVDAIGVSLSLDFVNQLFYAVRSTGLLDMEVEGETLGISPADVAFLFPGVTDLVIGIESNLAPNAVPGLTDEEVELQVGSMRVSLFDGPVGSSNALIQAWVSAKGALGLTATGSTVTPTLGEVEAFVDVTIPENDTDNIGPVIEQLLPELLPLVSDVLTEIEIPSFEGFTLIVGGAELDGAERGYYTLEGSLIAVPIVGGGLIIP